MKTFRGLATSVFGNISWQPPGWVWASGRSMRGHPKTTVFVALLLAAAGFAGWDIHNYLKKRPKPVLYTVKAEPIPETPLASNGDPLDPPSLYVHFNGSVAPIDYVGKMIRTGVQINPPMEGTWRWHGDKTLVFRPKHDWPASQTYHITIDKAAIAPHILLDRYAVDTTTAPFAAKFTKYEFYQDLADPRLKKVVATLVFSHQVSREELEKHLTFAMLGGSPVFNANGPVFAIDMDRHDHVAYVTSAPVTLPEREDFMKAALDAKLTTTQGGAKLKEAIENKVRIPDNYSFFKIQSVNGQIIRNKTGDPEQLVFINTTALAKSEELAKSLEIYLLPKKAEKVEGEDTGDADSADNADDGDDNSNTASTDTEGESDSDKSDADNNTENDGPSQPQYKTPRDVDEETLKAAKLVKFTVVPSEDENTKEHMFKIQVDSDGSLYIRVRKGARALGDFALGADYDAVLQVPEPSREIEIQGAGGVLALNGERKLSVRSRGVEMIEYEIARVPSDQINHLVSQTEGSFQNPDFVSSSFDEADIARIAREKQPINVTNRYKANYSTFDFSSHLGATTDGGSTMQGLFFLKASAWDPKTKKYIGDVQARRFVLVTDIGILVKRNADGSRDIFLQSIKNRAALGGVAVDVLARNGVPAVSGISGPDGHVAFPKLGDAVREKEPVAIVARLGNDVAFIPYNRNDRKLDFSRFDVDGIQSVTGAELDAFVFTERGVYRPGDDIHVAFSVKQHNWGGDLAGLPVETEVVDARGMSAQVKKISLPPGGVAEFTYQTAYESPTGDYTFNVYLVRKGKRDLLLGSTGALVKEFLPDRMKIDSQLSSTVEQGWIFPKDVHASVTLKNLYGTPATDRRIVSKMVLNPTGFRFPEYKGYEFHDPLMDHHSNFSWDTIQLGEKKTDDNGGADFDLQLQRFTDATYRMDYYAEGFEAEGGRSVTAQSTALVSPLSYVVGYKSPDGDPGYFRMKSDHYVEFIAIDHTLKKIPLQDVKLDIVQVSYISVLQKQDDGTYAYVSAPREEVIHSETVSIDETGFKYMFPTGEPGSYRVVLHSGQSGECLATVPFDVVGFGAVSRSLDKNAELAVKLNRKDYNAGDDIEVSITAPYTGSGLITIERDKVYAWQWFKADKTGSVQHIKLPEGFDGTGYVNVSFIRGLDSKEVFMSPLSYGVVPFTANREKRSLKVELTAATEARPGEPLKIKYKTNHPAKIVVYAVDQGILQVTGYELPDPLGYYFRKYALMVQTSQIVDLIMPEYSVLRSSAFGGDGEARHLNPFKRVTEKPVVFWSGVIDADTTEREVTYNVPDYFSGTLTVMAVAMAPDSVGSVQQDSLIRGPFVLTPGVPTLAAPGDQFEVGVTVANNAKGSGTNAAVTLSAEVSEHLQVVKMPPQPMTIPEGKETSTVVTVRALDKLGSASITFKASANGQESKLRSTLSVRPAVPFMTELQSGNFTKETVTVPVKRDMLPEYRSLDAVVSSVPLGLAHGLDTYLKNYPNGCSEQITSGAFCRLMLSDEADFALPRAEVYAQLEKTFDMLRRRQNDQGAFGYWSPESSGGINFVSVYVMHFLAEAKDSGFVPPADVFQSGLRNLQQMVVLEPHNLAEARIQAYAIYVLTREEVITTNYILNLRDYLDKNCAAEWKEDITAVYLAGALAILKKDAEARKLVEGYPMAKHNRHWWWYDFYTPLGADSQYVAIVARHFPDMLQRISAQDFEAITGPVGRGEFNTLSASYAVMALKSYSRHMAENPPALTMAEIGRDKKETELSASGKLLKRTEFSAGAAELRFGATPKIKGMGAFYQVVETGFDRQLPAKVVKDGLEVYREFIGNDGKVTDHAMLGKPLHVRLSVRGITGQPITNVSIIDLLPGGFEVVGSSLKPGTGSEGCDYVDLREDRAVFFTTVDVGVKTIDYEIKACNRGEFVVPSVFAESMYDRGIKARGLAGHITVTEAK